MAVPILIGAEVVGLLYVSNQTSRELTDDDEAVCVLLTAHAAIAIQNARAFARGEAARAAAESANREKDEFLAMLGHELRNPLGAIGNAVQVLDLAPGPEDAADARAVIERQLEHLTRLVDDLLDVSRALSGKIALERRPLDLAELVARVTATMDQGGRTARHVVTVEAEPAWIDGDPLRIEQVVTNLVENALKYTPAGGAVRVTVRPEAERAVLSVVDTGVGIRRELLERVFDLFVQGEHSLDRRAGGLGIGLTLVRRIVDLHGGVVEVASDGPGQGSRFTVRLPALAGAPASPSADAPGRAPAAPRRRVLVVEDNDDAREMLCRLLRLLGHEPHEAADGLSGVARALDLRPDLTLVDIGLPGLDGYEVAKRIRAHAAGRELRLVALTGYGLDEDRARALAAGYDLHLVKPMDSSRLAEILDAPAARRG
jgi:signal transduction histidine kinase/CheY-like chemotaxis protein